MTRTFMMNNVTTTMSIHMLDTVITATIIITMSILQRPFLGGE